MCLYVVEEIEDEEIEDDCFESEENGDELRTFIGPYKMKPVHVERKKTKKEVVSSATVDTTKTIVPQKRTSSETNSSGSECIYLSPTYWLIMLYIFIYNSIDLWYVLVSQYLELR